MNIDTQSVRPDEQWRVCRLLRMAAIIARNCHLFQITANDVTGIADRKGQITVCIDSDEMDFAGAADFCAWLGRVWEATENENDFIVYLNGEFAGMAA